MHHANRKTRDKSALQPAAVIYLFKVDGTVEADFLPETNRLPFTTRKTSVRVDGIEGRLVRLVGAGAEPIRVEAYVGRDDLLAVFRSYLSEDQTFDVDAGWPIAYSSPTEVTFGDAGSTPVTDFNLQPDETGAAWSPADACLD
jgi:hypothetical protein